MASEGYPYLLMSLLLAALAVAAVAVSPRERRRPAILSGLLGAPFSCASALVVPEYWNPVRVAVWLAGPEDLLFSFSCGTLAWLASTGGDVEPLPGRLRPALLAGRYLAGAAIGLAIGGVCRSFGAGPMTAMIAAMVLFGVVAVLVVRPPWHVPVRGSLVLLFVHFAAVKVSFLMAPGFALQWNGAALWGATVLGVPAEELVWAAAYGAVWPSYVTFVFGREGVSSYAATVDQEA